MHGILILFFIINFNLLKWILLKAASRVLGTIVLVFFCAGSALWSRHWKYSSPDFFVSNCSSYNGICDRNISGCHIINPAINKLAMPTRRKISGKNYAGLHYFGPPGAIAGAETHFHDRKSEFRIPTWNQWFRTKRSRRIFTDYAKHPRRRFYCRGCPHISFFSASGPSDLQAGKMLQPYFAEFAIGLFVMKPCPRTGGTSLSVERPFTEAPIIASYCCTCSNLKK